jgi:glycosyltransferase involved in cell wall biosynthesis
MNILLINHYAGSIHHGMEYRPYYLAREWQKLGHKVTILAASNAHVRSQQFDLKTPYESIDIDGIEYIIFNTPPYEGNGVGRIFNMLSFVKGLYKASLHLVKTYKPDAVIASSTYPLDIFPARHIAKKSDAKLVFEIHDLWPLSPMELGGFSKWHPFIMMMQMGETAAFKSSDKVVSILPFTEQHCLEHGLKPGKFKHIPNGIVLSDWNEKEPPLPSEHQKKIHELKQKGYFLVGYAGGHGLSNALDSFVNCAQYIKNKKIALILVGKGPEKEKLVQAAKDQPNVIFLPAIQKQEVRSFLKEMDVLFVGLKNSPLYRFGLGLNKFFDYMMAQKPVVCAVGYGKDSIEPAQCALCCEPENPQAIAEALDQSSQLSEERRLEMAKNGYLHVTTHHDYSKLAESFIEAMK